MGGSGGGGGNAGLLPGCRPTPEWKTPPSGWRIAIITTCIIGVLWYLGNLVAVSEQWNLVEMVRRTSPSSSFSASSLSTSSLVDRIQLAPFPPSFPTTSTSTTVHQRTIVAIPIHPDEIVQHARKMSFEWFHEMSQFAIIMYVVSNKDAMSAVDTSSSASSSIFDQLSRTILLPAGLNGLAHILYVEHVSIYLPRLVKLYGIDIDAVVHLSPETYVAPLRLRNYLDSLISASSSSSSSDASVPLYIGRPISSNECRPSITICDPSINIINRHAIRSIMENEDADDGEGTCLRSTKFGDEKCTSTSHRIGYCLKHLGVTCSPPTFDTSVFDQSSRTTSSSRPSSSSTSPHSLVPSDSSPTQYVSTHICKAELSEQQEGEGGVGVGVGGGASSFQRDDWTQCFGFYPILTFEEVQYARAMIKMVGSTTSSPSSTSSFNINGRVMDESTLSQRSTLVGSVDDVTLAPSNFPSSELLRRSSSSSSHPPHCHLSIGILSTIPRHSSRERIRRTWGRLVKGMSFIKLRFVLGGRNLSPHDYMVLHREMQQHSDVLILPLVEDGPTSFFHKTLGFFDWSSQRHHCSYIFKTDDDSYVRILQLLNFIRDEIIKPSQTSTSSSSSSSPPLSYFGHKIGIEFDEFLSNNGVVGVDGVGVDVLGEGGLIGSQTRLGAEVLQDPNHPYYMGHIYRRSHMFPIYMSGRGYGVTRELAELIVEQASIHHRKFETHNNNNIPSEDIGIGLIIDSLQQVRTFQNRIHYLTSEGFNQERCSTQTSILMTMDEEEEDGESNDKKQQSNTHQSSSSSSSLSLFERDMVGSFCDESYDSSSTTSSQASSSSSDSSSNVDPIIIDPDRIVINRDRTPSSSSSSSSSSHRPHGRRRSGVGSNGVGVDVSHHHRSNTTPIDHRSALQYLGSFENTLPPWISSKDGRILWQERSYWYSISSDLKQLYGGLGVVESISNNQASIMSSLIMILEQYVRTSNEIQTLDSTCFGEGSYIHIQDMWKASSYSRPDDFLILLECGSDTSHRFTSPHPPIRTELMFHIPYQSILSRTTSFNFIHVPLSPLAIIVPFACDVEGLSEFLTNFKRVVEQTPGHIRVIVAWMTCATQERVNSKRKRTIVEDGSGNASTTDTSSNSVSNRANVESIRQEHGNHPRMSLVIVRRDDDFARGIAINYGMNVLVDDEIAVVLDIDMRINSAYLRHTRAFSLPGHSLVFPISFSRFNPTLVPEDFSKDPFHLHVDTGVWRHYGFGMTAFPVGDIRRLGITYDASIKGWGQEDVNFANRFQDPSSGLSVLRMIEPHLIHIWHDKNCQPLRGTTSRFNMCMASKVGVEGHALQIGLYYWRPDQQDSKDNNNNTPSRI